MATALGFLLKCALAFPTPEKADAFRLNPKARVSSNPPPRSHNLLMGPLHTNAFSGLAFRLGIDHSSRPADYQTLSRTVYKLRGLRSDFISSSESIRSFSYRHGCDPPKNFMLLLPQTARITSRLALHGNPSFD